MGTKLKKKDGETLGPGTASFSKEDTLVFQHACCISSLGPAAYGLPQSVIPAPVIGEKLDVNFDPKYPAPNKYDIPSSIDSNGGKTFGARLESRTAEETPFGTHNLQQPRTNSYSLTYRAFPQKCKS